ENPKIGDIHLQFRRQKGHFADWYSESVLVRTVHGGCISSITLCDMKHQFELSNSNIQDTKPIPGNILRAELDSHEKKNHEMNPFPEPREDVMWFHNQLILKDINRFI